MPPATCIQALPGVDITFNATGLAVYSLTDIPTLPQRANLAETIGWSNIRLIRSLILTGVRVGMTELIGL